MLMNATAGSPGDVAVLLSHQIENTGPLCAVTFWYNMKGTGVGKLQVFVTDESGQVEAWSQVGQSGDGWFKGGFFVGEKIHANISFLATRGSNKYGDIALDDIHFSRYWEILEFSVCMDTITPPPSKL